MRKPPRLNVPMPRRRLSPISVKKEVKGGVHVAEGMIYDTIDEANHAQLDISEIQTLQGRHNWQNAAAAYAVARVMGIAPREIASGLRSFPGLQHRMELVATVDNVRFINDSKATNPEAAAQALGSYRPIYWIAGGKPKGPSLAAAEPFYDSVQRVYLVGAAEEMFAAELEGKLNYVRCGDLATAFQAAATDALRDGLKDSVVLLSPACASFDQWASFEARGDAFRLLAQEFAASQLSKKTAASGAG